MRDDLTAIAHRLLAVALIVALAACGALPRPFQRDHKAAANPLVEQARESDVEVAAVTGTAGPMGKLLAEAVAKGLRDKDIAARALSLSSSSHVLSGRAEINRDRPDLPYVVLIHWRLADRRGNEKGTFTQGVEGQRWEWDYGAPNILSAVGKDAATRVAKLVLGDRYVGINVENHQVRQGFWIGGITGAPGDGNESLARGIRIALGGAGYAVTTVPDKANHHLSATVTLSPAERGAQVVNIAWAVKTPDGRILGHARQANAVAAGSLDGAWGQTAAYAAAAAIDGIQGVINSAPRVPPQPTTTRPGAPAAAGPATRGLPQVPGRALPPPG